MSICKKLSTWETKAGQDERSLFSNMQFHRSRIPPRTSGAELSIGWNYYSPIDKEIIWKWLQPVGKRIRPDGNRKTPNIAILRLQIYYNHSNIGREIGGLGRQIFVGMLANRVYGLHQLNSTINHCLLASKIGSRQLHRVPQVREEGGG